jgi:purine-nucleoside phosphorylase
MNVERKLPSASYAAVIARTVAELQRRWPVRPRCGIILGTGLGQLASHIECAVDVPYQELPGFPRSTATGHRGRLLCGHFAGQPVIAFDGRFHLYEGYTAEQITLPIHVLRQLGGELLIVSNASGGLRPNFRSADVLAIADHIDLMGQRTAGLGGVALLPSRRGGPLLYDAAFIEQALAISRQSGFPCHRGVYVGVLGPNFETRAEYRFLRRMGGDAVGMSTIPEVLAAAGCGLRVLGLSTITNIARPDAPARVDAQHVVDLAATAEPRVRAIVQGILRRL